MLAIYVPVLVLHALASAIVTAPVAFTVGPAAAATSSITANPTTLVANGTSSTIITVTAKDALGNLIQNTSVGLMASGGNNTFDSTAKTTNSVGTASFTLTSTQVQTETITATFASAAFITASVQFTAGPPVAGASTLSLSPTTQVANNSNSIAATLTLNDALGHPVAGQNATFSASGSSTTITASAPTDVAGKTTVAYRSTMAQNENAIVAAGGGNLTAAMTFIAGPPSAATSTLSASPNSNIYASGTEVSILTITLKDAFGNAASNQNVIWGATSGNNAFVPAATLTNLAGGATTQMTSLTPGLRNAQGTIGGLSISTPITFIPGGDASKSSFTASPTQVMANGSATIALTLLAHDSTNSPLAGTTVKLFDALPTHTFTPSSGPTDSNGLFTANLVGTQAGTQLIDVQFAGAKMSAPVTFSALTPGCAGTAIFGGPPWPAMGSSFATGAVAGDFNGDSNQDIAILSFYGSVFVSLSQGYGLFAPAINYGVNGAATSLAVGDLNQDGILDLACTSAAANSVGVMLGNADGTFQSRVDYAVGSSPQAIIICDLNGDSKSDIAVTNQSSNTVSVLYNSGNGTFNAQVSFAAGNQPVGLAAAPLAASNANDLVVTNPASSQVSVLVNAGSNSFAAPVSWSVGSNPKSVSTGDLNGDTLPDLVVANNGDWTLGVLFNQGSAAFAPQVTYATTSAPSVVALKSLNGGVMPDIVAAVANSIEIFGNTGNGNFMLKDELYAAANVRNLLVADLNADGFPDIIAASGSPASTVPIFYNHANYSFSASIAYAANFPKHLLAADFDADGFIDLFVTNLSGPLTLYNGTASGTFTAPTSFTAGGQPVMAAQADFNADGRRDIVVLNGFDQTISIFLNQGARVFSSAVTYPTGANPTAIAVGDIDEDGMPDIAVINSTNKTVGFFINNGAGVFTVSAVTISTGNYPNFLVMGDFNSDGLLDMAFTNRDDNSIAVALNLGAGSFGTPVNYNVGNRPEHVATGDVDGDGRLDLVVANEFSNNISVLLNTTNMFAAAYPIATGSNPINIVLADINGDALLDIFITNSGDQDAAILYNLGNGNFGNPFTYPTGGTNPVWSVVADFNQDGHNDFASVHSASTASSLMVSLWTACH